jgi:hypothetical protein
MCVRAAGQNGLVRVSQVGGAAVVEANAALTSSEIRRSMSPIPSPTLTRHPKKDRQRRSRSQAEAA